MDIGVFQNQLIRGGFTITLQTTGKPMVDAIGREALAKTSIVGRRLDILIRIPMAEEEFSITIYHEILEGVTVASIHPPESVMMLNEGDFEAAAQKAHAQFGMASPENLDRMLQSFGFKEE